MQVVTQLDIATEKACNLKLYYASLLYFAGYPLLLLILNPLFQQQHQQQHTNKQ